MTLAESLERVYRQHRQQLFDCALGVVQCPAMAEDAVHDAFVKLFALPAEPKNLKSYAFRAVRNAAVDLLRRRRRFDEAPEECMPELVVRAGGAEDDSNDAEQTQRLLAALSEDEREVILLHLWSDLRFREIAGVVDRPLGTVVSLYRRGLERMRLNLRREYERIGTSTEEPASTQSEQQAGCKDRGLV
jgi:RNA polymerase sigma-70 factor (ECF subfamily)